MRKVRNRKGQFVKGHAKPRTTKRRKAGAKRRATKRAPKRRRAAKARKTSHTVKIVVVRG